MKSFFARYTTTFDCSYSMEEIVSRIMSVVAEKENLKVLNSRYDKKRKIRLCTKSESILCRSAGMHVVIDIEILKVTEDTRVIMTFSMRKIDKIVLGIFYSVWLLLQAVIFVILSKQAVSTTALLLTCAPMLAILLFQALTLTGIKYKARKILRVFHKTITGIRSDETPVLKRC